MNEDIISLREHFEKLLVADKKLQDERWIGHDKVHEMDQIALDTALDALNARLEQMNLFRAQILEERRDFLRTELYVTEHRFLQTKMENEDQRLATRVHEMERYRSNLEGRLWMLGATFTVITIALNLVFRYWGR